VGKIMAGLLVKLATERVVSHFVVYIARFCAASTKFTDVDDKTVEVVAQAWGVPPA
jgi:hypothetical protein